MLLQNKFSMTTKATKSSLMETSKQNKVTIKDSHMYLYLASEAYSEVVNCNND